MKEHYRWNFGQDIWFGPWNLQSQQLVGRRCVPSAAPDILENMMNKTSWSITAGDKTLERTVLGAASIERAKLSLFCAL